MTRIKQSVLMTDRAWPDFAVEKGILEPLSIEVIEAPSHNEETLSRLAKNVDAIATCWAQVTPAVIQAATNCRVIARFGIGLDNIAVETATERGIPVTYVPDYCVPEVSEHTIALLLACARKVAFFHHETKRGRYNLSAGTPLRRLTGQTLGLIGFGRIGRSVDRKARSLGLNVMAHSLSGNDYHTGCQMVGLETLLEQSDFVSLHLPLSQETQGLLGTAAFARMKPSAFLINTSRGGLIDHVALADAIHNETIAGAAIDVFDPEPPDLSQPLFQHERVIVTPHAAFMSEESLWELRTRTAQQVADALDGRRPQGVVNPQVYDKSA